MDKRFLSDPRLSLGEKGFLAYCFSKPDNWRISVADLTRRNRDGRDAVRSSIRGCEKLGYATRQTIVDPKIKRFIGSEITVYEVPFLTQNPGDGFSGDGFPGDGKSTPIKNNRQTKNEFTKNEQRSERASGHVEIVLLLTRKGLRAKTAEQLACDHTSDRIFKAIAYVERQSCARAVAKPTGYLIKAIREGYQLPHDGTAQPNVAARQAQTDRDDAEAIERERRQIDEVLDALSADRWQQLFEQIRPTLGAAAMRQITSGKDPRSLRLARIAAYRLIQSQAT
jgi:hypothetical protein